MDEKKRNSDTPTELSGLNTIKKSPSVEKKILEHRIQIDDLKYNDTWRCCQSRIDKRSTEFFTKMGFLLIVLSFSIVQLVRLKDCNSQGTYLSLLTLILGYIIPSPKIKKNN